MKTDIFPDNSAITRDYKLVIEYAREASTIADITVIRRGFKKHIPEKSPKSLSGEPSTFWGRDRWIAFESLPYSYRELVDYEPVNPTEALQVAVQLWQEFVNQAQAAMDRIVRYEMGTEAVDNLPDWLTSAKIEGIDIIRELKKERLEEYQRLREKLRKELEEREAENKRRQAREKNWSRYVPPHTREYYTLSDGTRLQDIAGVKHVPPHIARQMIQDKLAKEVKFTRHLVHVPGGMFNPLDNKKKNGDSEPPLKVHPAHYKPGRNC